MPSPVPPWMQPPPDPSPVSGGDWFPHIIRHEPQADGTVLVTWALPGLASAVVRVPMASWLQGDHQPIGRVLSEQVTPYLPVPYRPARREEDDHGHAQVDGEPQGK